MKATLRRRWAVAAVVMVCRLAAASVSAFLAAEHRRNDALIVRSKFLAAMRGARPQGDPTGALLALAAMPGTSARRSAFHKGGEFALRVRLMTNASAPFSVDPPPGVFTGMT